MSLNEQWQRTVQTVKSDLIPKLIVTLLVAAILGAGASVLSALAAGAAAVSAFYQARELAEHQRQLKYEQSQRGIEAVINLTMFWNSMLDDDARSRIAQLRTSAGSKALMAMVDERIIGDEASIAASAPIVEFMRAHGVPDGKFVAEASKYRTTILKLLNAMDAVSHVRRYASEGKEFDDISKKMIDDMFMNVVQARTKQFKPFIDAYRSTQEQKDIRAPKAWENLAKLVEEGDWKP